MRHNWHAATSVAYQIKRATFVRFISPSLVAFLNISVRSYEGDTRLPVRNGYIELNYG
jgi:hypothetical protein